MTMTIKIQGGTARGEESFCQTCRCAHIRKGFRESEEQIFCGVGEGLRPVLFKIAECTDYANRSVPYRYELEQMALLINVPPTRKKAGFKRPAGFAQQGEKPE